MIEGALILFAGIVIGIAATLGAVFYLPKSKSKFEAKSKFDKYRNTDGLYSTKVIRESR